MSTRTQSSISPIYPAEYFPCPSPKSRRNKNKKNRRCICPLAVSEPFCWTLLENIYHTNACPFTNYLSRRSKWFCTSQASNTGFTLTFPMLYFPSGPHLLVYYTAQFWPASGTFLVAWAPIVDTEARTSCSLQNFVCALHLTNEIVLCLKASCCYSLYTQV